MRSPVLTCPDPVRNASMSTGFRHWLMLREVGRLAARQEVGPHLVVAGIGEAPTEAIGRNRLGKCTGAAPERPLLLDESKQRW